MGEVFTKPKVLDLDPVAFTTTAAYVSVKADFFFLKGYKEKLFRITNTGVTNGLKFKILAANRLSGAALVTPEVILAETTVPLSSTNVQTLTDRWRYIDIQVIDAIAASHTTGTVEVEAYS